MSSDNRSARTLRQEVLEGKKLTDSEIAILYGMARGMNAREMAEANHNSVHTINTHRKDLIAKLGAKNNVNAVVLAIANGVIDITRIVEEEE